MKIERPRIVPLHERLIEEQDFARREALNKNEIIEPTEEEKKNGWTAETLTKYLQERHAAQNLSVDVNSLTRQVARRKDEQNHKYNPRRWRSK